MRRPEISVGPMALHTHQKADIPRAMHRWVLIDSLAEKKPPMGCTGLALRYCMSSTVCTNFYRNRMSCGPELDIQKLP